MTFNQTPIDDMVVVRMIDIHAAKEGRIKLPEWQKFLRGEVLAVGPGAPLYTGGRAPMECKVGDTISFPPTAGMDTLYGVGSAIRIMRDTDCDAIWES